MKEPMRRYSVPCHTCEGKLIDEGTDDDGQRHVVTCRWCYRGSITIQLTRQDEQVLFSALKESLER